MKQVSPSVKIFLSWLLENKIENLFSKESLDLFETKFNPDTKMSKGINILIEQLPDGIYDSVSGLKALISNSIKTIYTDSVSYSPFVSSYKEFKACKVMKYTKGNIITGRDKEIEQILTTLRRRNKRGLILVGEAGVGKTAIVQAVNARLIERTIPRQLIGCEILNMDVPYILSKYKEESISVIIGILEKASEYDKAILFIDEVHQLLGHRMNDILKPYLTEKIRFIGSTTVNEYHAIITEDSALERRFTVVNVAEPNIEQTIGMVKGTKSVFEEYHKCVIPDKTCEYLVTTGSRFLGNRKNPDKSLDVLDIACSIMYEKEIKLKYDKISKDPDFLTSLEIKRKELESIHSEVNKRLLSDFYVNLAISSLTGVRYDEIANSMDYNKVKENIKTKIYGQDKQIDTLSNVVNIFKHVKYDRERPVSVLLFVGPPGVGKKSSAKLLSKNLFGTTDYFIDYDMSAFKDGFTITELKGSPPGYVGYGKSGGLIKSIRNNPLSVVYFRSIDKAHETIVQYLIDGCRNGKLTDSAEREAMLNNTIVVFSVTLSQDDYDSVKNNNSKVMGFGKAADEATNDIKTALKKFIAPDLITICDEIIVFDKLEKESLERIYKSNLDYYLQMYNVEIDRSKLEKNVLENAKNGHDIISRLSSEIPKLVFKKLSNKEKTNGKKKSVPTSDM